VGNGNAHFGKALALHHSRSCGKCALMKQYSTLGCDESEMGRRSALGSDH
jgi:hypothetical protein